MFLQAQRHVYTRGSKIAVAFVRYSMVDGGGGDGNSGEMKKKKQTETFEQIIVLFDF